jgi:hypothetical protein
VTDQAAGRPLPHLEPLRFPFSWRRRLAQDGALLGRLTHIAVHVVRFATESTPSHDRPGWRLERGRWLAPLEPQALAYDKPLCASLDGFTLHAATRAGALDPAGREALLRYRRKTLWL